MSPAARGRRGRARLTPERDQDETPFAAILRRLLDRVPGAYAAALVDLEGETVDYAGAAAPFDLRVAAAHIRIVLEQIDAFGALGTTRWLVVRGAARSVVARKLPEGYAVVVLLRRRAGFTASWRAFAACERELAAEAGWSVPVAGPRKGHRRANDSAGAGGGGAARPGAPRSLAVDAAWWPVCVEVDPRGRPTRVTAARASGAGAPEPSAAVEVLGTLVGLPARERGFRVRTERGNEMNLVREARSCWYADVPVG